MTNSIEFPISIYDFLLENSFKDTDEVYTNGSLLIPTFRVKQAIEHYYKPCEDCISRKDAIRIASINSMLVNECIRLIKEMPSVTPSYNSIKTELEPCEDAISREALVNELKCGYWNKELQSAKNDTCVIDAMIDWSIRTVKSQPSVTPQPKKGKWNVFDAGRDYTTYSCSECGRLVTIYYDFGKPKDVKKEFPFCNCGADMRESETKE